MPRRREIPKRDVPADPLYESPLVSKFINCVMSDGKRSTAERILYKSFDIIKDKTGDDPLKVFKKAVDNVKPSLEVKSRRVGGSNYQVPVEVNPNRRLSLSIRWLVGYATARGDGKTMYEKLANELLDAANLRGGAVKKREVPLDPIYSSALVTKFISTLMSDGKRSTAERIMYGSLSTIQEKTGDDPLKVFKKAIENVKPALEVKSRRVGGSNYQVPVEVNPNRRLSLSIRWLVGFARDRGDGKTMTEKLANELMDAANLRGGAVKKREDTHRMAEANKAFAHYRW